MDSGAGSGSEFFPEERPPPISSFEIRTQRKILEILRILEERRGDVVGARVLAEELRRRGFHVGERTVRHYLKLLDRMGFTAKMGYSGRRITAEGLKELEEGFVCERLGQPLKTFEHLICNASFDPRRREGSVVALFFRIRENHLGRALAVMREVAPLSFSPYVRVDAEGGVACVATPCSVTLDALLLRAGVLPKLRYCGVLRLRLGDGGDRRGGKRNYELVDAIFYEKTTLDPVEVFVKRKMTAVCEAAGNKQGTILVSCREVPAAAGDRVRAVFEGARSAGLGGLLFFERGAAGGVLRVLVSDGANMLAAVEECGIETFGVRYGLLAFDELDDVRDHEAQAVRDI
ncbi:MAG: NrpR regulatory domain-containing protein [Candidatus Alkanophagales archaeon]